MRDVCYILDTGSSNWLHPNMTLIFVILLIRYDCALHDMSYGMIGEGIKNIFF